MANIIKYTTQLVKANIGNIVNDNLVGSYFWSDSYTGLPTEKPTLSTSGTAITWQIPECIPDSSKSSITATINAAGLYDIGSGKCTNTATSTIEIRQHATINANVSASTIWVGQKSVFTYNVSTLNAFNKSAKISYVNSGVVSALSGTGTSREVTGIKKGTVDILATPADGVGKEVSKRITVRQQVTQINTTATNCNIQKGGSYSFKVAVSATNNNDSNATANIESSNVIVTITGSASISQSTASVAKNTSATSGTEFTISTITTPCTVTLTATGAASSIQKKFNIYLNSNTLANSTINPGDSTTLTISGGTGSCSVKSSNSAVTFSKSTGINMDNETITVYAANTITTTTAVTITVTPTSGAASTVTLNVKPITLTLS